MAQDTAARTEMELQRLQRKVKKMAGPQTTQMGIIPEDDVELLLEDEGQIDDFSTQLLQFSYNQVRAV